MARGKGKQRTARNMARGAVGHTQNASMLVVVRGLSPKKSGAFIIVLGYIFIFPAGELDLNVHVAWLDVLNGSVNVRILRGARPITVSTGLVGITLAGGFPRRSFVRRFADTPIVG